MSYFAFLYPDDARPLAKKSRPPDHVLRARRKRAAARDGAPARFALLCGSPIDLRALRWSIIGAVIFSAVSSPMALALFAFVMPSRTLIADVARDAGNAPAVSDEARDGIVHRAGDGLFYVRLHANGVHFRCLIDTGASDLILSSAQAAQAGVSPEDHDFSHRIATAGGSRSAARTVVGAIDVAGRHFEQVPLILVKGGQTPCLMGQHLLARFDEVKIHADELRLR